MSDLKPCPFCGKQPKINSWYPNMGGLPSLADIAESRPPTGYDLQCNQSHVGPHHRHHVYVTADTKEHAIESWNTRARDAEVAGLREALKEVVTLTVPRCGGPWTADINRIATNALAARATPESVRVEKCGWSQDEWSESWSAGCGCEWVFPDGGPAENGMKFCPSCGKPVSLPAPPTKGASRE